MGLPSLIMRYMPIIVPSRGGLQISSVKPPSPVPVQRPAYHAMSAIVAAGGFRSADNRRVAAVTACSARLFEAISNNANASGMRMARTLSRALIGAALATAPLFAHAADSPARLREDEYSIESRLDVPPEIK